MPTLNLTLKPKSRPAAPHKAKDRYRKQDHQHDDRDRQPDQEIVVTVDRRCADDRADHDGGALRAAFGAAATQKAEKAGSERTGRGESGRDGRGGGEEPKRRHQRTQKRAREIEVPEDQMPVFENSPPAVPESHWTELPLADEFREAARGTEESGGGSGRRDRRAAMSATATTGILSGSDRSTR